MIVHCKRAKFDIYIGRPGRYGNPWIIGKHGTREEVIEKYRIWLTTGENFGHPEATKERRADIMEHITELEGKVLGCWCAPNKCHGEVLLNLLKNEPTN